MRLSSTSVATLIAAVALLAGIAGAQPEPWVHPDGSIHYYDAISTPSGLNWNFAWDSALGHGGYLATIASQAENDFVFSLVDSVSSGTSGPHADWPGRGSVARRTSAPRSRTAAGTGSRTKR